ncbi:MAG: aminotransferase class I/II-fold pyridoxal phosphate-dependent enzyme, partial [Acholeplasmataceae bacterium]|nr:aminotransferase class I/II-fold pyridoxal phosphate-dependent enzyme [Acholeplasmataceae bacterium]
YFKNPSLLSITALKAAYKDCDKWMALQNQHLSKNYQIIKDYFHEKHPQVILSQVEGTYLVWLDMNYLKISCEEATKELMNHHISVGKGTIYSPHSEGYFRLNFACSTEQLKEGLKRLSETIKILEENTTK